MRKTILCSLLLISLGVFAKPYDHSLGISGGMFNGLSYKALVRDHFAVQTDVGVHFTICDDDFGGFEISQMLMWQPTLYSNDITDIDFVAGGGLSLGFSAANFLNGGRYWYYSSYDKYGGERISAGGEFGFNAIAGVEFAFNRAPLALSIDFRPGYGLFYGAVDGSSFDVIHYFDWGLNLGLRFYL